jgi:hypothetical protein
VRAFETTSDFRGGGGSRRCRWDPRWENSLALSGRNVVRISAGGRIEAVRGGVADDFFHDVEWAGFHLFIDSADVFADDAEEEKQSAGEKSEDEEQCGETLWGLMEKDFCDNGIQRIKRGERNSNDTDQSGGANWNGGERENRVRSKL